MNISCAICSDLLAPSDDVFFTPCGHVFHFACLTQWLERSLTCPQCRNKVTQKNIHRIYFNFSNNDTIVEDSTSLQSKIDGLNFQIMLKDKDIRTCGEENARYKTQTAGLRAEVKKLESKINGLNSTIYALNEQTKYFKEQGLGGEAAKREVIRLRKKIEDYKNIEMLLSASVVDVDEMIANETDYSRLTTYISVMKREITNNVQRRKELRDRVKALQQELTKVSMERNFLLDEEIKRKQLEEDLKICEGEKRSLQSRVRDLEQSRVAGSSSLKSRLAEIKAPKQLEDVKEAKMDSDRSLIILSPSNSEQNPSVENSPYLPVKSQGITGLAGSKLSSGQTSTSTSGFSILSKKPRLARVGKPKAQSEEIVYNGLGGHSKLEQFSSPIMSFRTKKLNNNTISMKLKRRKVDEGTNKLANYFDLTKQSSPKSEDKVLEIN